MMILDWLNLDSRYQALMNRTHSRFFKTRVSRAAQGYMVMSTYNPDTNRELKV